MGVPVLDSSLEITVALCVVLYLPDDVSGLTVGPAGGSMNGV